MTVKTKESTRPKRMGRGAAALLLALSALLPTAFAAPALAGVEEGESVWIGPRQGYSGTGMFPIYAETPADTANPGDPDLWAYCIEHDVSARTRLEGETSNPSEYLGANNFSDPVIQARVHWTLTHGYPAVDLDELAAASGITDLARNDAIEATQYAIWNFTDLWSDPETEWTWETPNSEAVYHYLVEGALAGAGSTPPPAQEISVSVAGPATATAGTLVGPYIVSTDQPTASVSSVAAYPITDSTGAPVDTDAVVDGQELYLDLRAVTAAGSATITATVQGAGGTGLIVSVPAPAGGAPTEEAHAQTIALIAAADATTSASTALEWAAVVAPEVSIGTTLVDAADDDHTLPWDGGAVIDTIAYTGLTPGTEYTVAGELMRKSDGTATGLTGSTTFTPTTADGTVDVSFTIPTGYAGQSLVAFETLYTGATAAGEPVAEHTDINDVDQTVALAAAPAVPAIGTTLLDAADDDHTLPWDGGAVIDTIAYTGLTPGTEYTVAGELMRKSDGTATGLTGSTTFTPTTADGTVDVSFTIPTGYAGQSLVAFETLYTGATAAGEPVAEHTDINDVDQTVAVMERAVVPGGPGPSDGGDGLATTGGALPIGLASAAAMAVLSGLVLVLARRRIRSDV